METVRRHLARRPLAAAWLIALALLLKAAVPPGYMPVADGGRLTVALCSGFGPQHMAMPGMAGHGGGKGDPAHHDTAPCAFAGLAAATLAAADPVVLTVAPVFVVAAPTAVAAAAPASVARFLRPPPRAPPPPAH